MQGHVLLESFLIPFFSPVVLLVFFDMEGFQDNNNGDKRCNRRSCLSLNGLQRSLE